jgi:hypothetical protein
LVPVGQDDPTEAPSTAVETTGEILSDDPSKSSQLCQKLAMDLDEELGEIR